MWEYALAVLLHSIICFAQISPIVPVNQPYSSYYHRYGLGSGVGYGSSDLTYGASLYGGPYGECRPCCPSSCSRLGGIPGGSYYGMLLGSPYNKYGYRTTGSIGYDWPIRGYSNYWQSLAGYPSAEIRSSELLGSAPLLTPDDCQDRSAQCALWASTGQCASNAAYMHRVCPQSCGIPCLSSATGNYGTSPSGYGLTSSYDPYGLISKYGVGIGSPLLGPTAYTLGTGYGIDSITNPIYRTHGGYGLESLAGSGYGLDSALGSFDLGLSGLGPQYGLSYDSRSGFNNYGLGMMDGLANSYGIDSGYGGDSTAALLSQYAMLSGGTPGLRSVSSPLFGHSSQYGIGLGSVLDPYELRNGYGSYGNYNNRGMGVYQSGIYPYSQKEKKSPSVHSSGREAKRTFTRLFGSREH